MAVKIIRLYQYAVMAGDYKNIYPETFYSNLMRNEKKRMRFQRVEYRKRSGGSYMRRL